MKESFTVRPACTADYEQAIAVLAEVDELHQRELPWMFRTPESEPRSPEFFSELLSNPDTHMLIAERASEVVGVATALMRSSPAFGVFIPQRFAVLDSIAIASAWRRRGVGTALFRAAEVWALARGASWIEVGVFEFNAGARAFYEALGYFSLSTKLRKALPPA